MNGPGLAGPQGTAGPAGPTGAQGSASNNAIACANGNTAPTTPGGRYIDCGDGTLIHTSTRLMWGGNHDLWRGEIRGRFAVIVWCLGGF